MSLSSRNRRAHDRDHYESKCAALDRRIDALRYELSELTPEEIAIVEGWTCKSRGAKEIY